MVWRTERPPTPSKYTSNINADFSAVSATPDFALRFAIHAAIEAHRRCTWLGALGTPPPMLDRPGPIKILYIPSVTTRPPKPSLYLSTTSHPGHPRHVRHVQLPNRLRTSLVSFLWRGCSEPSHPDRAHPAGSWGWRGPFGGLLPCPVDLLHWWVAPHRCCADFSAAINRKCAAHHIHR